MSLENNRVSISDVEEQAMTVLGTALREHIDLAGEVSDLIATVLDRERVVSARPDAAQSRDVTVHLLGRLSRDVRCIVLLAERGYALQAATLAACAFEVGYTIAYIGCDDQLGEKWLSHCDTTSWRDTKALLNGALNNLGVGDTVVRQGKVDGLYNAVYRPVAGAKHANPNLQRLLSSEEDASINSANGPMVTEQTMRMAEHAVLAATNAGIAAIRVFVPSHMPAEQQPELIKSVDLLEADYARVVSHHNSHAGHAS